MKTRNRTTSAMGSTRRGFIHEALAAFGFAALPGGAIFAAPSGWKPKGKPRLVFGVLSDTHLCSRPFAGTPYKGWPTRYFGDALRHFKSENVDAVVHCGDAAHRGRIRELEYHAEIWRDVFGKHGPAKLFVTGNHEFRTDTAGTRLSDGAGMAANWERVWGEPYGDVWHKTVNGIHFFGRHHGVADSRVVEVVGAHFAATKEADGPFFVISHFPISGALRSAVGRHPNGLGFFGHIHHSAANWNEVRYDQASRLPVVQCPTCHPHGENTLKGDRYIVKCPIEGRENAGRGRQGYVVKVYDEMLVIERREFGEGGNLGADWVMPFERGGGTAAGGPRLSRPHPFAKAELRKRIGEPQFREGAKLEAAWTQRLCVRIPLADGNPGSRAYAYKVVVQGGGRKLLKAVYASGVNMGVGHEPDGGVTTLEIPSDELPKSLSSTGSPSSLAISVRPLSSLGTSGRPITAVVASRAGA